MKDKPSEWVSIADLMAGVMAIVMLLLVVSVIQRNYNELKLKNELEQGVASQRKIVSSIFNNMKQTLKDLNLTNLADFDTIGYKITFKDGIFERGSALVTPQAKNAFSQSQIKVMEFLEKLPKGKIYVEGHTDNVPVARPVIDFQKFGAVYDDNFTLSAARAREARKYIIGKLSDQAANRVIVAGYGSSFPIDPVHPENACNRRVEIKFVID